MGEGFEEIAERLFRDRLTRPSPERFANSGREPVHVVYGGANLFTAETPRKFGKLALRSLETYTSNFAEFATAFWLKGADTLPRFPDVVARLDGEIARDPDAFREKNAEAWFAWTVHKRVIEKLRTEPVEDFRIDFEDGYGIRSDEEEDSHAIAASNELARVFDEPDPDLAFSGFRIKSFQPETYARSTRTLGLFLRNLLRAAGRIPPNFAVTLPKIESTDEVAVLADLLEAFERDNDLRPGSIGIETMIETPFAVANAAQVVAAGRGRVTSAHFGAFDYTAAFGITADHQHLQHEACKFARNLMQLSLAPLGIRVSDSVTTEMPVPVFRGEELSPRQESENRRAVHGAWRKHFNNVTHSLINGFFQSWDLHPAQLVARYAAVYAFFLESAESQGARLRDFVGKATRAMVTGNLFDDAASAQGLLNFFVRAVASGALTVGEAVDMTGLTESDLASMSFSQIMKSRES